MATVICVDGPAASGKSTVSKAVAERTGRLYVDSGALYRIVTWQALEAGVDTATPEAVADFVRGVTVDFVVKGSRVAYEVGGVEPGDCIRTPEINRHVSPVSAVPAVRERVTGWLRDMRRLGDLIVEGRDIGSVVYPDSPWRFYLDADPEERARRRLAEDVAKGFAEKGAREQVKASLLNRDKIDSSRKTAPLVIPPGATRIDTTSMTIDDVVNFIITAVAGD
ncbi:MAG: (d)CMP kinase [Kiritimatiellia bacterium]|jgi:cytidylate kinase